MRAFNGGYNFKSTLSQAHRRGWQEPGHDAQGHLKNPIPDPTRALRIVGGRAQPVQVVLGTRWRFTRILGVGYGK
jgi:hypothetical protein